MPLNVSDHDLVTKRSILKKWSIQEDKCTCIQITTGTVQNTYICIWLFWIIYTHRDTGHKIKEWGYEGHTQTKKKKKKTRGKEKMATFQGDMQWSLCTRAVEACWGQGQTRTDLASMRTRQKDFVTKRSSFTNKKDNKLKKQKNLKNQKIKTMETQLTLSKSCLSLLQTITAWYLWKLSIAVTELIMDMHTLHVDLSFFNVSCEIFLELSG